MSSFKENLVQMSVQNWQSNLHCGNIYDVYKSFKSVIMTGTYLGVLEQKYSQMYTADLGSFVNLGNFPDFGNLT